MGFFWFVVISLADPPMFAGLPGSICHARFRGLNIEYSFVSHGSTYILSFVWIRMFFEDWPMSAFCKHSHQKNCKSVIEIESQ